MCCDIATSGQNPYNACHIIREAKVSKEGVLKAKSALDEVKTHIGPKFAIIYKSTNQVAV